MIHGMEAWDKVPDIEYNILCKEVIINEEINFPVRTPIILLSE